MSDQSKEALDQWEAFLAKWPASSLQTLTLEGYYALDNDQAFYSWIAKHTDKVGQYYEGPLSAGVRLRTSSGTVSASGLQGDDRHIWYTILGDTAQEAFETLKNGLCLAVKAARSGDLSILVGVDNLPGALLWKVAFLYQRREAPCVLPIYSRKYLRAAVGQVRALPTAELHKRLLAERGDEELFAYADQVVARAKAAIEQSAQVQTIFSRFASEPSLQDSLKTQEERALFARLAQALHDQGWDWWTVESSPDGSIRCGRNKAPDNNTVLVLAELDPRQDGLRLRFNKGVESDALWQPLSESLVAQVEQDSFAENYRRQQSVTRPGLWPVDYSASSSPNTTAGSEIPHMESQKAAQSLPLNQILFGPPGTGKTYATIDAALEILDPVFLSSQRDNRVALKQRFEELMNAGRIRFITFHQSFSYEDFVEGLRAVPDESSGQLCYEVVDGVFKSFCKAVAVTAVGAFPFLIGECFGSGYKVEKASPDLLELIKPNGKSLPLGMSLLTTLADYVRQGLLTVNDIREKRVFEKVPTSLLEPYLVNGYNNILPPLVERLLGQPGQAIAKVGEPNRNEARVFIIDEINRGNVSRIFGELITLIEPSKRTGADEALSVTLPYSKEDFSVPDTVYLIGTMNTADRSLAGLDIALRRRFTFREMPPRPSLLDDVWVINQGVQVSIARLLERMNQRIEVLLDRDHCLGHAFFMEMKTDTSKQTLEHLSFIFRQKILPLLQEYFFEDWERIGWVLNDQNAKGDVEPFICKPSQQRSLEKLFGAEVAGKAQDRRWELNEKAFQTIDSYRNIIGNP